MLQVHCTLVHYVIPQGAEVQGVCRPAFVVREWSPECVNLQVLLDGTNDDGEGLGDGWVTSRLRADHTLQPDTWHVPEACPHRK